MVDTWSCTHTYLKCGVGMRKWAHLGLDTGVQGCSAYALLHAVLYPKLPLQPQPPGPGVPITHAHNPPILHQVKERSGFQGASQLGLRGPGPKYTGVGWCAHLRMPTLECSQHRRCPSAMVEGWKDLINLYPTGSLFQSYLSSAHGPGSCLAHATLPGAQFCWDPVLAKAGSWYRLCSWQAGPCFPWPVPATADRFPEALPGRAGCTWRLHQMRSRKQLIHGMRATAPGLSPGGHCLSADRVCRVAVVCRSNVNRSMEAHHVLRSKGFAVRSFGTGSSVKLPGPGPDLPVVYDFSATYEKMYNDLLRADGERYRRNGLLHILGRNKRIKPRPERFQECTDPFDIIFTCEESVYDRVLADLCARDEETLQPVHVINVNIRDTPEDASLGALLICDLCQRLQHADDMEDSASRLLLEVEKKTGKGFLHTVCFY
ncbi:RNA polymerase II subunit A C-terminal domain phosphatase SSU72 [Galemys pyrenaicus]|uniref:protein-serine/threonine phosphatase n=1 Tax=Galemys pyrenaicus TaxID=202257 RepID=A0A8J6AVJ8_GALPY|nr:RNA polymerase II subunit A C-terminal domain phosphatase SSU72 [Galemys pyrenaicus]